MTLPSEGLPAAIAVIAGEAQTGTITQPLADTLIVRVTDAKSRPVANVRVAFIMIAGGASADLIPDTAVTNTDGQARSVWLLGQIAGAQRVEARVVGSPALKATINATALAGQADTLRAAAGDRQSGIVGAALADSLAVLVTDRFGNPIAGQAVQWTVPAGQGSVSAAATVTGPDGRAAVLRILGPAAGTQAATATAAGLKGSPVSFVSTATAGGAVLVVKVSGDLQSAPAGFQLTDSLVVQVQDANGNGVSGRNVNWVTAPGNGSASPQSSVTNAQGMAYTYWTLHTTAGPNILTAAVTGLPQVSFTATGGAAQPTTLQAVSTQNQGGTVGLPVTAPPSVRVRDANNNPVQGVPVTFTVTAGGGSVADASGSGTSVQVATNAQGIATLSAWTLGATPGTHTVAATATNASGGALTGSPVSFTAAAAAGAATQVLITTQPAAAAQSGVALTPQPAVALQDAFGNAVAQGGVSITAALVGAGAQLRGTLTVTTNASGVATFAGLDLFGTAGAYAIRFTSGGLTPDTSTTILLSAGAAAQLAVVTQPSASAQSGVPFPVQPAVQVRDAAGNDVSGSFSVSAAIATGGGTLSGTTPVTTNGAGLATFADLAITGSAGSRTLSFTSGTLTPATSTAVTLGAGTATALAIVTQPSSAAQSGALFGTQPIIELRDGSGNTVPQAGVGVTVSITGTPAGVTLGGTTTVLTGANGQAAFSGLSLTGPAGNYTLDFTATALTSVTSGTITLAAGGGTALTLETAPPATAQSGVALSPAPVLQLRDGSGNAVSQAGVAVFATITSGAGGSLAGADTVLTNASGVATFSTLNLVGPVGSYTLAFGGAGLTGVTANPLTLSAGPAAALTITAAPPATAQSGIPFTAQPVLQVVDGAGNPVSQAGITVTAAIASGGGTLSGTTAVASDAQGVVAFGDLALSGLAGPRLLSFSAAGLVTATSGSITLGAGAAANLAISAGNGQTGTAGSPLPVNPQVRITDLSGNPVAGVSVTFTVTSGGGSAASTQVTDAGGFASVSWTLGTVAGANTLDATATLSGGAATVTFTATGQAGSAGKLAITTQPAATAQSGVAFSQQPVIQLQDINGNNLTTNGVAVVATAPGSVTLGGNTTVFTVNGVATFTNLALAGAVGSYQLSFSGSQLTGVTSSAISLTAGAASKLVVVTQPSASNPSGVAFAQQPVIQVQDAAGNPVASSGRTVTAAINSGPGGSLGAVGRSVTTDANGVAAYTVLTLTGPVGSYTLLFSTAGLASDASAPFDITAGAATQMTAASATSQSAPVGTAVAAPPAVLVRDAQNNPVAGVAVSFQVTAGGGSLNGGAAVTDNAGLASVTGWTLGLTAGTNTVTATASGLPTVTFNATGTAGAATTIALNAGNGQTATVNAAVATPPSVKVTDANGNAVSGAGVTFAVTGGGGSLTGGAATTNASGIATVGSWTLGTIAGTNTLTATSGTLSGSPVSFTATGVAGAAATIALSAGNGQSATAGTAVAVPPAVLVTDAFGNPKSGVAVTFAITGGGGSLTGGAATTNASGIATVGSWTLGVVAGPNTLTATAAGLTGSPVGFTATGTSGAATTIAVNAGNGQSATVGTAVATPPSVKVTDAGGNPVSGVPVTFAVTAGGGSVQPVSSVLTDGAGLAAVTSWTLGLTAGANTLTATAAGLTGSPVGFTATGTAGTAATLALNAGNGQSATVNTAVATPPSVKVTDANGNAVSGVSVTFAVTGGGGSLTGGVATTNASGIATVGSWTLGTIAGTNTLSASSGTLSGSPVGFTATGTAGAATTIALNAGNGQSAPVGTAVAVPPAVLVTDGFGNPKSGVAVTFAVTGGGGSVTGGVATSNTSGIATVGSWTLGAVAGANSLTATAAGLIGSPVGFTATGTSGTATKLAVIVAAPTTAQSGIPFTTQPVVQLQDASGNPVAQAGVTVSGALFFATRVLSNASAVTDAAGQATFAGLTIAGLVGTDSLSFTATGLTSTPRTPLVVTAGTAVKLAVTRQATATMGSGVAFTTQPQVRIQDSVGNNVSLAGVTVTATIASGPVGATILNPTALTSSTGTATFAGMAISGPVGVYTVQYDGGGYTAAVSANVTITPGPATALTITTQPLASVASGTPFNPPPVVQLRDGAGNAVPSAGIAITASVASGPGGTLSNTVASTDAQGAATFTGLTLTGTAGNYTLSFGGTGLTPVVSSTVALSAGGGSKLGVTTQPSSTATNGVAFPQQPVIQLQDGAGNPVLLAGVSVTATVASGGGTLGGTTSVLTNASGQATFTNLVLTGTVGTHTLLFAANGYTGITSNAVLLVAGAATQLALTTAPSSSAQSGVAFATQPVVQLRDQSGNNVSTAGVTVTASFATGSGTLVGTAAVVTNGSGQAVYSGLGISGLVGNYTLRFSGTSLTSITTGTIALAAGPAATILLSAGNGQSATAGSAVAVAPAVLVTDASNNPVAGVAVAFAVTAGGGSVSVPNALTASNGIATPGSWTLGTVAGSNTLTATNAALTGSPVSFTATGTPGAATTLVLTTQPSATAQSGAALVTQPVVQLRDANGNNVSTAGVSVTAALATGTGSLGGTTSVSTNGSGQAVFTNLVISGTAGSFTLGFSGTGLSGATSNAIALSAGAAATITLNGGNGQSATVNTAVATAPSVLVTDASSNPVSGVGVTFAVTGGGGSVSGGAATTNASGIASPTSWTLGTTAGTNTLTATAAGLTGSPVTFTATGTAGAATQLAMVTQPSATAQSGVAFPQQPAVRLLDQFSNPVGTSGVAVDVALQSGGGTLSGTTQVNTVSGVATFSGLAISGAAGAHTLGFSSTGLTGTQSTSITVSGVGSTTSITSVLPATTVVGESYTVGVTVTGVGGTPTGTVVVSEGTASCNVTLSGGSGSCALASPASGTRTVTATYGGDASFLGSSANTAHTVNPAATTTSITADTPDPSSVGAAYTVSYTVTPTAPGAGTPTGNVTVSDGVGGSCVAAASAGGCSLTSNTAGSLTLTASYAGDANFTASTSAGVNHTVNSAATTTTITAHTPDPSVTGQGISVSFSVTSAGGTPTGSVTVSDGAGATCNNLVSAGSCTLTPATAGAKSLVATYAGDGNFGGSISPAVGHTVNTAATTTAITADTPDPSTVNTAYTVSFAVAVTAPGAGTPTGNVTVSDGTDSCVAAASAGSCALTSTTVGAKTLVATYAGDANFAGSVSAGAAHTVNLIGTTTTITGVNPATIVLGQAVTVSFTVSGGATGNVTVSDGTGGSCIATVAAGSCSFTPTTAGAKTISATYAGDATHGGSSDTDALTVSAFGPPDAGQTTASVPGGAVGSTTTITVQLRDSFGNLVTTTGGSIIAASVSAGPNAGAVLGVADNGDGTYTLTYDPLAGGGNDLIDITLSGTPIGGSPYTSSIP